jgi:hypothetical protein
MRDTTGNTSRRAQANAQRGWDAANATAAQATAESSFVN